jgi:glutamyl-tRNA reductase
MFFNLVGLNHNSAPIEVREQLAFSEERQPDALRAVAELPGVAEVLLLSTCNRVEILTRTVGAEADISTTLMQFLAHYHQHSLNEIGPYLYSFQQRDAIQHLFRVSSSLDSMIVGETQILGQVKNAHTLARSAGTLCGPLDEAITRSFHVAKRVRTETGIASLAVSVSYAAVELAKKIFGSLEDKKILLIGAGKMSELASRHLLNGGSTNIFVANRTLQRAEELARMLQGRAVPFQQLLEYAAQCDIIISSVSADNYIIDKLDGQKLLALRRNRPMFLIDIAVPRNIDPEINKLDNLFLYDIDDLEQVVTANLKERRREAHRGEQIADQELEKYFRWLKTLDVVPTIVDLQSHLEQIRLQELARARSQLVDLTEQQQEVIDLLTRGLIHKILHQPIHHLKSLAQHPDGTKLVETVRKIFNLKQ